MSEVKRYLPVPGPVLSEGPQTAYAIETPTGPYVLFDDYDNLARELDIAHGMLQTKDAELTELRALCESLQNRWASRPLSHPDGEALEAENARLSEALIRYGSHINDCPKNLLQPDCDWEQPCTCGFSSGLNS